LNIEFFRQAVVGFVTLAAACTDMRAGVIPNRLTYPTWVLLLALSVISNSVTVAACGAFVSAGALLTLHMATNRRGIGLGDVKLAACIGTALGPAASLGALGTAFVLGGSVAIVLVITKRGRVGDALPFAPFLAIGTLAAILANRLGHQT
jgi:prepilin signal peptidase PulO-like enzyme (type II secretory pathway)